MTQQAASAAFVPLVLAELRPVPITGLTRGWVAATEAERELIAMKYRYLRAIDRMRTGRAARAVQYGGSP